MSEVNNLNDTVEEIVEDAGVMTVPIDDTLSISGVAADSKAVGDALALKADKSELANTIKVNGQSADLQGEIIVDGTHIEMSTTDTRTVQAAVAAAAGRTGADIPLTAEEGSVTVADAIASASADNAQVSDNVLRISGENTDSSYAVEGVQLGSGAVLPVADPSAVHSVNGTMADSAGNVSLSYVDNAGQLVSENAQTAEGEFIRRTSGGLTNIQTGSAWLGVIRGACEHTGQVPESITYSVESEAGEPIDITINNTAFKAAAGASGTYTFTFTAAWDVDPATYGISVDGTPTAGDVITVVYVEENRGTITAANPSSFAATGWNLYNHTAGYARVLKYSDDYNFGISGAYTSLQFSATEDGIRVAITPVGGIFSVPSDGYVFVNGGNSSNTAIWMTWSDWQSGYQGSFAQYAESTVDFSSIMTDYFPYGLMSVGAIRDEINLTLGIAYQRIERLEYTAANLAQVIHDGRAYDADTDYIYAAYLNPIENSISLDGEYSVSDHGMEVFEDTDVPVYAQMLYGENLIDKLRNDVVTISSGLANNLTTTDTGKALDARQGKVLNDRVTTLNSKFTSQFQSYNQTVSAGSDFTFEMASGSHAFCGIAAGFCHLFMTGGSTNPTLYTTDVPSGFKITNSGLTVTIHRTNGASFGVGVLVV